MGHLLSHKKEQSHIALVRAIEQTAELGKNVRVLALAVPNDILGSLALWGGGGSLGSSSPS